MRNVFFISFAAIIFLLIFKIKKIESNDTPVSVQTSIAAKQEVLNAVAEIGTEVISQTVAVVEKSALKNQPATYQSKPQFEQYSVEKETSNTLKYEVDEDGLVTVDGDIVLGTAMDGVRKGEAQAPDFQLWPDRRIPFFIQGDLEEPARIVKALAMFVDTPIQFVPYQGEEDVLVFESAISGCKSYLGKVGGRQPIWISPQCGPKEIAHEIMHALGFIHEQNRTDRDTFIRIQWDNIVESKKINFEIFPHIFMTVSGKTPFDFNSLMIYQATSFTKNGLQTMTSVDSAKEIAPTSGLSTSDLIRIENTYRY